MVSTVVGGVWLLSEVLPSDAVQSGPSRGMILRDSLSYLNRVPEVAWFEASRNNVYIGFSSLPADWNAVIRGAALRCSAALDSGCHAWAVDSSQHGWRPGAGPYHGEVTARHGRIEE